LGKRARDSQQGDAGPGLSENMPCRGGKEGEEGGKAVLGDDTMVYGNMGIRAYGQTGMWHTGSNFLWLVAGWEGSALGNLIHAY
jgi:hypothetical protein